MSSSGVLSRYIDLSHSCRESVVESYTELFRHFQEKLPDVLLNLADQAESNVMQAHCMDVRQEICDHRNEMTQLFYNALMTGFENFILGKQEPTSDQGSRKTAQRQKRLSLVEKETFEIELAFDTIANNTCVNLSEHMYALNLRLAVINGGNKPGERSTSLPGSPHHACNAYRSALTAVRIPIDNSVKISLIEAFEKHVLRQAESIYKNYNELLIKAGILPNLEDVPVYTPPEPQEAPAPDSAAPQPEDKAETKANSRPTQSPHSAPNPGRSQPVSPSSAPQQGRNYSSTHGADTREEIIEQEVFQQIRQLLQQRRGNPKKATSSPPTRHSDSPPTRHSEGISELISALNQREHAQGHPPIVPPEIAVQPLEQIRAEFSAQLSHLSELITQHQLDHSDADVIELVGMLFELVLNDPNLPDSVKALLSHLHTPYLKVALLDRKFFFKRRHSARRLLNLLTQAGSLCNATEKNEQVVFNRMRKTVNWILTEFDDNVELFDTILTDFEEFLQKFQKQARMMEKRSIEKAKGQERLREARQAAARELIEIIHEKTLPQAAEKLLFGPWSNLLVLLYLRKGADSEVRQHYLLVTREIVWSVQPKSSSAQEQYDLKKKLPEIKRNIQQGLALLGDPESSAERLLEELGNHQQAALRTPPGTTQPLQPENLPDPEQYPLLQEIDPEELRDHEPRKTEISPELEAIFHQLQRTKLGTWFELENNDAAQPLRAKLSWFSSKTSYYIFVNQAGIQVAVKPLKKLAREIQQGKARVLELDKKPFVERTLQRIFTLLNQPVVS